MRGSGFPAVVQAVTTAPLGDEFTDWPKLSGAGMAGTARRTVERRVLREAGNRSVGGVARAP